MVPVSGHHIPIPGIPYNFLYNVFAHSFIFGFTLPKAVLVTPWYSMVHACGLDTLLQVTDWWQGCVAERLIQPVSSANAALDAGFWEANAPVTASAIAAMGNTFFKTEIFMV